MTTKRLRATVIASAAMLSLVGALTTNAAAQGMPNSPGGGGQSGASAQGPRGGGGGDNGGFNNDRNRGGGGSATTRGSRARNGGGRAELSERSATTRRSGNARNEMSANGDRFIERNDRSFARDDFGNRDRFEGPRTFGFGFGVGPSYDQYGYGSYGYAASPYGSYGYSAAPCTCGTNYQSGFVNEWNW